MFKKYALVACIAFILGASVFSLGYRQGAAPFESAGEDADSAAPLSVGAPASDGIVSESLNLYGGGLVSAGQAIEAPDGIIGQAIEAPDGVIGQAIETPDALSSDLFANDAASVSAVIPLAGEVSANQSVSSVVKKALDSVVSINVSVASSSRFGSALSNAAGSGIIFSEDADRVYIVTNYHVVDGAVKATISLDDETQAGAHYVGGDSIADIAVMSVSKADLKAAGITSYKIAKFGDSDKIEVGDFAIAIGNAAGEGKSATFGIISAVDKRITIDNKTLSVIQTDAAINPGNSGGALINSNSEVIGVNTAKLSNYSGSVEGMGYSIPVNQVKTIVNGIMQNKGQAQSQPGYLGISGVTVTSELRDYYGFASVGVYVQGVYTGTGAYSAGLRRGDLVTVFNGVEITSVEGLNAEISKTKAGQTVEMTVYRSGTGKAATVEVTMTAQNGGLNF